ncbi:MAG: hypothetical protein ACOYNR_05075 [Blastocatellia bacterium]
MPASPEPQQLMNRPYRRAQGVLGGLLLAVLGSLVIGSQRPPGAWNPTFDAWTRPIYGGALVLGLLVIMTRRLVFSPLVMRPLSRQGGQVVVRALAGMTLVLGMVAAVVGIGGALFYQKTGDAQYLWRLGGIGLLLLVYSFPRRAEWERAVRDAAEGGD